MTAKVRKVVKPKFDWDGFKLLGGGGLFFTFFGLFLFWVSYTAPDTAGSAQNSLSTTQRIIGLIPIETTSKIAMFVSALFVLFGLFLILTVFYRSIRFVLFKK